MIALVPIHFHADAAQVVVTRHDTRTVMTVQPSVTGPDAPFTLVVPVPGAVVGGVEILPDDAIDAVERLDAPRVAELAEKDPCVPDPLPVWMPPAAVPAYIAPEASGATSGITITVVSADALPPDAAAQLRPYLDGGWQFVVATFDHLPARRVPPLRIAYDSEELVLPVGTRDLIVHVLAPTRHQAASQPNAFVATNLDVASSTDLAAAYQALFDRARAGGAVVTEYAGAVSFDGADLVLTRLHARGAPGDDLVLEPAAPVAGGRDVRRADGALDAGATASATNDFQARYLVRHPWTGPIRCRAPYPTREAGAALLSDPSLPSGRASSQRAGGCSSSSSPGGGALLLLALLLLRRRS